MASKRRVRKRSCERKLQYRNELDARNAAKRLEVAVGEPIGYYECRFCKKWHIGHRPRTMQLSLIAKSKRGD